MYEDLIKALRHCMLINPCDGCPFYAGLDKQTEQCSAMNILAADAIEDLQKQLQKSEEDNINLTGWLAEEHAKHLWIPVTKRLPEKIGSYLVYVYDEVTEMDYWRGKWHMLRDDYTKAVTHWMPLPEPPKEEP